MGSQSTKNNPPQDTGLLRHPTAGLFLLNAYARLILFLLDRVQLLMCHIMNRSLDCLHLTHAFLDRYTVSRLVEIPLSACFDILESNWHRTSSLPCFEEILEVLHVTLKFRRKSRKFLTVGLRDIKYIHDLEGSSLYFDHLLNNLSVLILNGFMSLWINLVSLDFLLIKIPREYTDSLLTLVDVPLKILLTLRVTCNHRCIRLLHRDKDRVIQAILMKLTHGIKHVTYLF